MSTARISIGVERAIIENMLDRNREALTQTARGLSEGDARRRLVASLTTPISLIKHAAAAERIWFQRFWAELDESECDGYSKRDEGTFTVAADESMAEVIVEFERASKRSREIASRFNLGDTKDNPREGTVSMRWTLLAMIEEFARHAGHGDILREQIDQSLTRKRADVRSYSDEREVRADQLNAVVGASARPLLERVQHADGVGGAGVDDVPATPTECMGGGGDG